ncbi:S9 family peptidase [uncultured Sphingorhabdus sp.]|uniref:alpha/beta hydrolase family protein n=1 Tax=uncultured Sphingorhabdus sp. TaxID=1686106 RepID=UPI00263564A7|nr:S9 family peptidase [uncultured Sphingorhabdus sp.]
MSSFKLGDVKVRDIEWASDEFLLIDYSQTEKLYGFTADKAEFYRTIVMSMAGGQPSIVFANDKAITNATFGWHGIRNIGGRAYGFFGGVPMVKHGTGTNIGKYVYEGGPPALYRVDLSDMKTKQIAGRANEGEWRTWKIDAAGQVAATITRRDGSGEWRILNADDKEIASGSNPFGGVGLLAFSNNGSNIIYYDEEPDTGIIRYFEAPLSGGKATELFVDVKIDRFFIDPRTGVLLGYLESGAQPKPRFFDPALEKKIGKIARAFPKLNRSIVDWSSGFGKIVLNTNGNGDSGTWWTVDLEKLAASPLGYERPTIEPAEVGQISTVSYIAADGLEMDGILTLPPGREPKNLPVIMLPHGGPTSHDSESFDWWAQAFAARGYAVFQPNFRGSTNRDATFMKAGHGEWGRKMQTDISDGLMHLASQGIVDAKRACIVGASYGGYAALAGVTIQQGLYRCAVSVAGVSDLAMMVSTDIYESGNDATLKRNLKAEIGSGRELKDVSPRRFATQADAPILLLHGKDDVVVPFRQSLVMADALKDAGRPYELVTLAGEDHWLSRGDTRLKMLQSTISFVEKHNPAN